MTKKRATAYLLICVMVVMAGCGFHLRGSLSLPATLQPLHVASAVNGPLARALQYQLAFNQVELSGPANARTVLKINDLGREKRVQALDARARAAEFIIWQRATATLYDNSGTELFPEREFVVRRVITNDPNDPVSESSEIDLIHTEMEEELAAQIARQLEYWGNALLGNR